MSVRLRAIRFALMLTVFPCAVHAQVSASPGVPASASLASPCPQSDSTCVAPPVPREFRGVWVATVGNIDWPSKPGLPTALQQEELTALLDRAAKLGLNAVIFQVRPAGDAFYASKIEPWSEYLTGTQGQAPAPFWDPLAFAVKEAHARGLELHAWFNPYRARGPGSKRPLSKTHLARTHRELVREYGTQLWMDPGEPAVRARTLNVVLDVVKRYDVDGVHLDDYFYPYPERRKNGSTDFPDARSWKKYRKAGGTLARDDWRRRNVDLLIEALHVQVARAKPWVKFGISPFGIWRPGYPESVTGFDSYVKLFADSRKWLRRGWADYFTPQLYWAMEQEGRKYPDLLRWWVEQDSLHRHMWPGNYTGRVGEAGAGRWRREEIIAQVYVTRAEPRATGNVHFSMKVLLDNRDSIATTFERLLYAEPALVPPSPWMVNRTVADPTVNVTEPGDGLTLALEPFRRERLRWWVVQLHVAGRWETHVIDGATRRVRLAQLLRDPSSRPDLIAVTAVDRTENASRPVTVRLP